MHADLLQNKGRYLPYAPDPDSSVSFPAVYSRFHVSLHPFISPDHAIQYILNLLYLSSAIISGSMPSYFFRNCLSFPAKIKGQGHAG